MKFHVQEDPGAIPWMSADSCAHHLMGEMNEKNMNGLNENIRTWRNKSKVQFGLRTLESLDLTGLK